AVNNLAYLYVNRFPTRENLKRASELLSVIPEDSVGPQVLDTKGWVHYKQGQYDEAIKVLERARAAADNPIIQLHLGLAYLKGNQAVNARDALDKAMANEGKGLSAEDRKLAEEGLRSLSG
ncbi:MAG TPA: tetratricopeptide repeat protein, partial [Desulfobacterales bacterium]|nr:tetratricopeptide repeat protein [Desulfobacterales bacterium]